MMREQVERDTEHHKGAVVVRPGARIGGAFHTDGGEPVHEAHALAVLGPY